MLPYPEGEDPWCGAMVLGIGSISLELSGPKKGRGASRKPSKEREAVRRTSKERHEIRCQMAEPGGVVFGSEILAAAASMPRTPPALVRRASTLASMAQQKKGRYTHTGGKPTFESLDYDDAENTLVRSASSMPEEMRHKHHRRQVCTVWILVVLTGFLTGSAAMFTTWLIGIVVEWKFALLQEALDRSAPVEAWLLLSAFVLVLSLCATTLTRWAPEASGSGACSSERVTETICMHRGRVRTCCS